MTPKEKAWNIFWNFKNIPDKWKNEKVFQNYYAKQCALLAVEEILKSKKQNIIHFYRCGDEFCECGGYWQEVKQEILKL